MKRILKCGRRRDDPEARGWETNGLPSGGGNHLICPAKKKRSKR